MAKAMDITGGAKRHRQGHHQNHGHGVGLYFRASGLRRAVLRRRVRLRVLLLRVPHRPAGLPGADLPRRGIPGALCFGCSTFAMIAPAPLQIPQRRALHQTGTTAAAGAVNGFLACVFMLVVGIIYLHFWLKRPRTTASFGQGQRRLRRRRQQVPNPSWPLLPLIITICLVNIKVGGVASSPR